CVNRQLQTLAVEPQLTPGVPALRVTQLPALLVDAQLFVALLADIERAAPAGAFIADVTRGRRPAVHDERAGVVSGAKLLDGKRIAGQVIYSDVQAGNLGSQLLQAPSDVVPVR